MALPSRERHAFGKEVSGESARLQKKVREEVRQGLEDEIGHLEVGRYILRKLSMVFVAHGIYRFSGIRTISDEQSYKWFGKAELAIEFLRPIRNRVLRVGDKAQVEAKARLEALRKSRPTNTMSTADTISRINEDRIELLQDLIEDMAISLNAGEIFDAKPSKVMDMLGQVQSMGNVFVTS